MSELIDPFGCPPREVSAAAKLNAARLEAAFSNAGFAARQASDAMREFAAVSDTALRNAKEATGKAPGKAAP